MESEEGNALSVAVARKLKEARFMVYVLPVIITCGCFANSLAFMVAARGRFWSKSEGYVYLFVIFATSFLMLLIPLGHQWLFLISGYYVFCLSSHGCTQYVLIYYCLTPATAWLVAAFAFDVYVQRSLGNDRGQCAPGFARCFCRNGVAAAIMCGVFALTGAVGLLHMVYADAPPHPDQNNYYFIRFPNWFLYSPVRIASQVLSTVVPMLFLLPLMFILVSVHGRKKPDDTTQPGDAYDSFVHFPPSAPLCLVAAVVVLQMVYHGFQFLIIIIEWRSTNPENFILFFLIIEAVAGLSYVFLPIVCLTMMPEFRDGVKRMCLCCKRKRSPPESAGEEIPLAAGQNPAPA